MSKFEWSFIKDYALDNNLTVEQVINKGRKGDLRLCGILDETNFPGGYLQHKMHRILSSFDFEAVEDLGDIDLGDIGTPKQNDVFLFEDDESIKEPHPFDVEEGPNGNPEDLILYADIGDRYFIKLDQISLLALLKNHICTTPTVQRNRFEELNEKKSQSVCSIKTDLDNVVIIITDELVEEERFPTRTKNNYLKVIGVLAKLSEEQLNLKYVGLLANKEKQGAAQIISEKIESNFEKGVSEQSVARYLKEAFELIKYDYIQEKQTKTK